MFSNEHSITIQVLMLLEGRRLREMERLLELLAEELNLPRIPHFATINKFSLRVKPAIVGKIIINLVKSNKKRIVAIGGTGFSLIKGSVYFGTVVGEIKQFIQDVAAANIGKKLIAIISLKRKKRNENTAISSRMKKTSQRGRVATYLGNKLYDSEKDHY